MQKEKCLFASSLFGQLCLLKITRPLGRKGYSLDSFKIKTLKTLTTKWDRDMSQVLERQLLRPVNISPGPLLQAYKYPVTFMLEILVSSVHQHLVSLGPPGVS